MDQDAPSGRYSLRKHRLGRKDFERAYRTGGRARSPLLNVVVVDNGLPFSRMGLSVGKRVSKLAVERNRVRRLFREAFRLSRPELPAGIDVVMIAVPGALRPTLLALRSDLVALCARARTRARASGPASSPPRGPSGRER